MAWQIRKSNKSSVFPALDRLELNLANRWSKPFSWHSKWLLVAAFYNIGFGFWTIIFPDQAFRLFEMAQPNYPFLWQSIGMIVGVYGIGYGIAALDEQKHWPIVFVGLLGKIFGPIGFVWAFIQDMIPVEFGTLILFNDLIWWPVFFAIIIRRFQQKN
jgi:hypothetical protein